MTGVQTCALPICSLARHLFRAKELLGLRLASIHNLRFVLSLMERIRAAILEDRFGAFQREFMDAYKPANEAARQQQSEQRLRAQNV